MRSETKRVVGALFCVVLVASVATSCGDFFPSGKAIVAMTISPTSGLVAPGATTQFTASGTLGNNQTEDVTGLVNWSSSNSAVATINQAGLATGVALGNATITATANSGGVTVSVPLLVSNSTSITVAPATATIAPGGTQQLTATDQTGTNITSSVAWTSSDTTQATVTSTGLVTVLSTATPSDTVTITGTLGSLTGTSTITIGL